LVSLKKLLGRGGGSLASKVANKEAPFTAAEDVHFALCCLVDFSKLAGQQQLVVDVVVVVIEPHFLRNC
jgi:hypothetical protein